MNMTNKTYDTLKWIALHLLPALGALYFAIASIWNLPYSEQVLGTITAIDAFIGAILGLSSANYKGDGDLIIDTSDPEKDIFRFELGIGLEEAYARDQLIVKVKKP